MTTYAFTTEDKKEAREWSLASIAFRNIERAHTEINKLLKKKGYDPKVYEVLNDLLEIYDEEII